MKITLRALYYYNLNFVFIRQRSNTGIYFRQRRKYAKFRARAVIPSVGEGSEKHFSLRVK